jgi:hypothetical protein
LPCISTASRALSIGWRRARPRPPTLPSLLTDLAASARKLRSELRVAESEALDIQVKVLAERLRQEDK